MSTLFETGVDANNCKCSRDQQRNVPSEARNESLYLLKKELFGSFRDLSIHRDRQREATLLNTIILVTRPGSARVQTTSRSTVFLHYHAY
jgi:hypothetical protein